MHVVTPRGTQCDTLYIIASIFSLIFATEWREKVNFVLKWQFFFVFIGNVVKKVYATDQKKPPSGSSKMGNNQNIPRLCLIKSKHHFPASGEELCRHKRGKYLAS